METIIGARNRVLDIDLTTATWQTFTVSEADRRRYLGGKGLGLRLLSERIKPDTDPLSPENPLCFMMGVLMGTGAPCSGRFAALTRSPLTGILTTSSCGGPFGMALKTAGYDGLLISGAAAAPTWLEITADGVAFRDASGLMGLDTVETQAALAPGKKDGALVIGPAGENRTLFANIASGHRFLGRGGMGAVMGAKNLKAALARGGVFKIAPADPAGFEKATKTALSYINRNDFTSRAYRLYGTASNVHYTNRDGLLPVENFRDGRHASAPSVSGETFREKYDAKTRSCRSCAILCGHKGTDAAGAEHQIPEYESLSLLGPNLGIWDTDRIIEFNDICCRMGMDTISAGSVLGYVMEAGEKGLIRTDLRFGVTDGVAEALEDMALRRGFGDEMANGVARLSDRYGGKAFAIAVKGLEMAAYDPRGSWGQGLAYAVANRGGCHLSAYLVGLESLLGLLDPKNTGAKPAFVRFFEDLTCCINSLHTCQFTLFAYTMEPPLSRYTPKPLLGFIMGAMPALAVHLVDFGIYRRLWTTVTGISMGNREFIRAGARIHVLERYMNTRFGISAKDDVLPERFLTEARRSDPEERRVPLETMRTAYYRLRGYDENGIPTENTLRKLGIAP